MSIVPPISARRGAYLQPSGEPFIPEPWARAISQRRAYIGSAAVTAAAGQNAYNQLWNPSNSPVFIIVHWVMVSQGAASAVSMKHHTVAIANLSNEQGINAVFGEGNPAGETRESSTATVLGTGYATFQGPQANDVLFVPTITAVLTPGHGMLVRQQTVALTLRTVFAWSEHDWDEEARRDIGAALRRALS